jgi:hypothetical protein
MERTPKQPGNRRTTSDKKSRGHKSAVGGAGSSGKPFVRPNLTGGIIVGGLYTPPGPFAPVVLVTGGVDASNNALASAEMYDIQNGFWTTIEGFFLSRSRHTATLLPGTQATGLSKLIIAGGGVGSSYQQTIVELYDEAYAHWYSVGRLLTPRLLITATVLRNGRVLVVGSSDTCEVYDPAQMVWKPTGSLHAPRSQHTATLLKTGEVLVAGGVGGGFLRTAELYDPIRQVWLQTTSLPQDTFGHTATLLPNGNVLVAGGMDNLGRGRTDCLLYDRATQTWTDTTPLNVGRTNHTATPMSNGWVMVVGGYGQLGEVLNSAEMFDPGPKEWRQTSALHVARIGHTTTLLPNGDMLVAGGSNSCEKYDSIRNAWDFTGFLNTARGYHTATLLQATGNPFFSSVVNFAQAIAQ